MPSTIRILELPGLPEGGDIVEFITSRKGLQPAEIAAEIQRLAQNAPLAGVRNIQYPHSAAGATGQAPRAGHPQKKNAPELHPTDLGNAKRLVRQHGRDLHYVPAWGRWIVWNGQKWAVDETGEVMRRAKSTILALHAKASRLTDKKKRADLTKHALHSESRPRLEAMIALAQSEPDISVAADQLDANPWLLNVANGTVDLCSGALRPHRREDLLTKRVDIPYDPQAACPLWTATLDRVLNNNSNLTSFFQRAVGYSLTGITREQTLFFLHGLGANGKSTITRTMLTTVGAYGTQAEPELLLAKRGDRHPTGVADLQGRRMVVSTEVEQGARMAEVLVKQLTGEDRIKARLMRQDFFEFEPSFKLWLVANHKPQIRGTDHAIWRRILLIPFVVTIPESARDKHLLSKLKAELPGILSWAVQGCLDWQRQGLAPPDEVLAATNAYRGEMDVVAGFLDDECVLDANIKVRVKDLYEAYTQWCHRSNENALPKNDFRGRLIERGLAAPQKSTGGDMHWFGIGLKTVVGTLTSGKVEVSGANCVLPPLCGSREEKYRKSLHSTPLHSAASTIRREPVSRHHYRANVYHKRTPHHLQTDILWAIRRTGESGWGSGKRRDDT